MVRATCNSLGRSSSNQVWDLQFATTQDGYRYQSPYGLRREGDSCTGENTVAENVISTFAQTFSNFRLKCLYLWSAYPGALAEDLKQILVAISGAFSEG